MKVMYDLLNVPLADIDKGSNYFFYLEGMFIHRTDQFGYFFYYILSTLPSIKIVQGSSVKSN